MPMNLRERILDNAKKSFRTKIIQIGDDSIEVRSPNVGQMGILAKLEEDQGKRLVALVIQSAHDPATGKPLFVAEDEAALLETDSAYLVTPIATAFMELVTEVTAIPKT